MAASDFTRWPTPLKLSYLCPEGFADRLEKPEPEAVAPPVVASSVARTPTRKWSALGRLVVVEEPGRVLCAVGVVARGDCARAEGRDGGASGRFSSCCPVPACTSQHPSSALLGLALCRPIAVIASLSLSASPGSRAPRLSVHLQSVLFAVASVVGWGVVGAPHLCRELRAAPLAPCARLHPAEVLLSLLGGGRVREWWSSVE